MYIEPVLFKIGHGVNMAKIGSDFPASCHNKTGANRNFCGGSWRPLCARQVVVAQCWWRKSQTTVGEERKRIKNEKRGEEGELCSVLVEGRRRRENLNLIGLIQF